MFDDVGGYYYRLGELLVVGDEAVVDAVQRRLGRRVRGKPTTVAKDVTRVFTTQDVPSMVTRLRTPPVSTRARSIPGLAVYPNHVLRGLGHSSPKPGSPPRPATAGEAPPVPGPVDPTGVRITVLDSGVDPEAVKGKLSPFASGDDDSVTVTAGMLDRYAGHGTFIAGILRRQAPGADIEVKKLFDGAGFIDDVQLATALTALATADVQVVVLSLGGYTADNLPCPAMEAALSDLLDTGTVVVAAAGNENTSRPSWPAAFKRVVAVAAVDAEREKACFSNYGAWVDACAEGVDIVSTFVHSPYPAAPHSGPVGCPEVLPEPGGFDGFARWSGTSFAAPRVAAAIAREIGRGVSPAMAVFDLLQGTPHPHRGLGVFVP